MPQNIDKGFGSVLGDKIALAVLRHLYSSKNGETGRGVAAAAGYSPQAVLDCLKRLEKGGFVLARPIGKANLYELNRKHWFITDGLVPLWKKMGSWKRLLGSYYAEILPVKPLSIIVFGSYARGEARSESDMDILFIFDDKVRQGIGDEVLSLAAEVHERYGVHPSEKIAILSEFKKGIKKGEGLMRNAFREGVSIYGLTPSEVLAYERKKAVRRSKLCGAQHLVK